MLLILKIKKYEFLNVCLILHCIFLLEVSQYFSDIMEKEPNVSASIAAISTLLKLLEHDKCK